MLVKEYYVQLETNLESRGANIVGGPVYENDDSDEIVGVIEEYDDVTGKTLIVLKSPVEHASLQDVGVLEENMIPFETVN